MSRPFCAERGGRASEKEKVLRSAVPLRRQVPIRRNPINTPMKLLWGPSVEVGHSRGPKKRTVDRRSGGGSLAHGALTQRGAGCSQWGKTSSNRDWSRRKKILDWGGRGGYSSAISIRRRKKGTGKEGKSGRSLKDGKWKEAGENGDFDLIEWRSGEGTQTSSDQHQN